MRIANIFLLFTALVLTVGCAGSNMNTGVAFREQGVRDFEKSYISYVNLTDAESSIERPVIFNACAAEPAPDTEYYIKKYVEEGYLLVGEVLLNKDKYNLEIVSMHCGKVGAERALYNSQLISSSTKPKAMMSPQFSFAKATFQGLLGNYIGSSSTKFTQSDSRNINWRNNTYRTWATYWVKANSPILGAYYGEIPNNEKYEAETVRGAYVYLVVNDSPAYHNNVISGDIITRLDDYKVIGPKALTKAISAKAGKKVKLDIIRKGEPIGISLTLNPSYS